MRVTSLIREFWRRDEEEKQRLRERIAYLEGRLAERAAHEPLERMIDAEMRARIAKRADELLSGGLRDRERSERMKRDMAERIAYHELLAEDRAAAEN